MIGYEALRAPKNKSSGERAAAADRHRDVIFTEAVGAGPRRTWTSAWAWPTAASCACTRR